jgi:hypothetical protein
MLLAINNIEVEFAHMAEIVLIHGIDQHQKSGEGLENEWLPALAGAMRLAGYPALADRLTGKSAEARLIARMAFYGHFFLKAGQQGDAPMALSPEQDAFAEAFAREWLERAASRATADATRHSAEQQLWSLTDQDAGVQGVRSKVRGAIAALAGVRGLTNAGVAFAERTIARSVAQVSSYFTDDQMHSDILTTVGKLITQETRVVIAHSLGSAIAYEAMHLVQTGKKIPLLVTLGSPLGLRTVIYDRLWPQPPGYPACVQRWLNVADVNDFVAAEPDLSAMFSSGQPSGSVFESETVDNGAHAHDAAHYLGQQLVGKAVGEALSGD